MKKNQITRETENKFLIYLDILGFEELARQIAKKSKIISETRIREDFIRKIDQRINEVKTRGEIEGKLAQQDSWLLVVNSLDSVFKTIYQILNHNSEYEGYEKIPLEIAVGSGQYSKQSKLSGKNLVCEKSTIAFLKTHITDAHRNCYREKHSHPINDSFLVISESVYEMMGYYEKKLFRRKEYTPSKKIEKYANYFFADNINDVQNIGMLLNFLQIIGKSNNSWFRRIDSVYVEPKEYQSIIQNLENKKIVFLIGDPEIGKTYTAARILWEYYLKGYEPVWNSGTEEPERAANRKKLCEFDIPNHTVIYFEDPFGKRRYEDREELRRLFSSILVNIQQLDTRVIISSREHIFKEFMKDILSQKDISDFIFEMKLMKPSYTIEKMTQILINWALEYNCRWLSPDKLKFEILIEAKKHLTTPLSLWDFAFSSKEYDNPPKLKALIKEKSKAIMASFAEEIAQMPKEKILFLSLISILSHLKPTLIKEIYHKISERLELNHSNQNSFESIEKQFSTKVVLNEDATHTQHYGFTHVSYENGVVNSWNRDEIREFLLATLKILIEDNDPRVRGSCGLSLIKNFDDLSFKNEAKFLIQTILRDKKAMARYGLTIGLEKSFKNIPINVGLEFANLLMADKNGENRAKVISIINSNFDYIPIDQVVDMILRGLKDRSARVRFEAVRCVEINIDLFPIEIAEKALKVNEKLCEYGGYIINYLSCFMYNHLKEEIEKRKSLM